MDLSSIWKPLSENLLSPIPMCFALGIFCKLIHGGIKIPKELYYTISIYLLMSIGFIGGHELAKEVHHHGISGVWKPALVTLFLGCLTPITAYLILKYLGRFNVADAAGIAAHYGSTSAVTFAVAQAFASGQKAQVTASDGATSLVNCIPNGYLPTLVTILECPGIAIALAIGAVLSQAKHKSTDTAPAPENGEKEESKFGEALYEVLTGQSIMLMAGLLVIGFVSTFYMTGAVDFPELKDLKAYDDYFAEMKTSFYPFHEFFYSKGLMFRGALCIFLLEMGLVAGERLGDLLKVGPFLVAFGILWPLAHGFLAAFLGSMAGLNLGGCTVFAAIVSSASYIAAPPAVRLTLPDANPTLSITSALAITFPFNIAIGIPIYFQMAKFVGATP